MSQEPHTSKIQNSTPLPVYIRLPKAGERCEWTGLTRSTINFLVLPSEANGYTPWVESRVVRLKDSQTRGVRLVKLASLLEYIDRLPTLIKKKLTNKHEPEASAEGEAKGKAESSEKKGGSIE